MINKIIKNKVSCNHHLRGVLTLKLNLIKPKMESPRHKLTLHSKHNRIVIYFKQDDILVKFH
jgi:hypothetical protein